MKRHLLGVGITVAVIGAGALGSACDITPPAATANGSTISTATLNDQLNALEGTAAGGCLLQLEAANLNPVTAQGTGGPGNLLDGVHRRPCSTTRWSDLLAEQYAAQRASRSPPPTWPAPNPTSQSTLDGEISQQVQSAQSAGVASYCQASNGANTTGAQLLAGLPSGVAAAQIRNQAVDEKLLARGADLSSSAVDNYYAQNQSQFTEACVSVITAATQSDATQIVDQLNAGASFASRGQGQLARCANRGQRWVVGLHLHPSTGGTGPPAADGHRGQADRAGAGPQFRPVGHLRGHQPVARTTVGSGIR